MIQAVVYDAVGTLIHVNPSAASIYAEVGSRHGSRLDVNEIRRRFNAAFAHQDQLDKANNWRTNEEREKQRWQHIVAAVLDDVGDIDACYAELFATFGGPAAWTFDPTAEQILAQMKQRGIRQALASNFDSRLRAVIEPMPIAQYLDPVVISSEVGWRKPSASFFALLAKKLQVPRHAVLFIGDDWTNDYEAALSAGMKAVLFDPREKSMGGNRISELSEALALI